MNGDKTRWRSHVGLPTHIIQDVARKAKGRSFDNIPRANDSNVRPKIIYVSRNASVRNDSFRSELHIPKRSLSHESVIPGGKMEIPLKQKIVSNGGLQIGSDIGFSPIGSIKAIDEISPAPSPPPPAPPISSPPPLISVPTPPGTPPPPPLPTSSPPPLDDPLPPPPPPPPLDDPLPPPPPTPPIAETTHPLPPAPPTAETHPLPPAPPIAETTHPLPPAPPSPTPSFHGNHINLASARGSEQEEEITRYVDMLIAKDNIIISETTQTVDEASHKKGDNSSDPMDHDSYLISKWVGRKVKTVRAYIKPGTVEELRELFLKWGKTYSNASAVERKKARRMIQKKRASILDKDDSRKLNINILETGVIESDSMQSDLSTITNSSVQSNNSAMSKSILHVNPPSYNVTQDVRESKQTTTGTVASEYSFPAYESPPLSQKAFMSVDKSNGLSIVSDNKAMPTSLFSEVSKESALFNNTHSDQSGLAVTSSNASKDITGSYSGVWTSSLSMDTTDKQADDTNGWSNEVEMPVLPSSIPIVESDQRHSRKDSSKKNSVIDENMESDDSEPDELDDDTRQGTVDFTHVTDTDSSSASSIEESREEEHDSLQGPPTTLTNTLDENEPTSPREKYDDLISEFKRQTSERQGHVTDANISEANSETSSAKFSFDEVKEVNSLESETAHTHDNAQDNYLPTQEHGNLMNEFKSVFMKRNHGLKSVPQEDNAGEMPVLSGSDDLVTHFNIPSNDVTDFANSQQISSNMSDIMAASTSSQRSSKSMQSSSSSSFGGSVNSGKPSGDIIMVEGSNGSVYMVEDISDSANAQETLSTRSSRNSSSRTSQSGGNYQIGSSGNLRIDSNVDNDTANEVISALYGLSSGDKPMAIGEINNNQKALSLRSSHSSGGSSLSGVISLPGTVSVTRDMTDDNNVTQDVTEHETVTIHGVTEDNIALIEHRVLKTISRRKEVEDSTHSVDNELTIDTGSNDYNVNGYNQGSSVSYSQPMLVTTQEHPVINLGNSAMKTYTTSVLVPNNDNMVSTYNAGTLVAPSNPVLDYSNSAFQVYNPGTNTQVSTNNGNVTTITNNSVTTTTEYTLGNNEVQSNYVKAVEPTETSYKDVQAVLNNVDNSSGDHVTTISNTSDNTSKHTEDNDNETNYYSKKTVTTTILPSVDIDSVYGSKSSRTTSEESPRDDEGPLYRVVSHSMSPRRSPSPKRKTIYHEVDRRARSPSPRRQIIYDDGERRSRSLMRDDTSDVFRSDHYLDSSIRDYPRRDLYTSEPQLARYKDERYLDDVDDSGRRVRVSKTYASNRRKSSGFNSSDSDISEKNVGRSGGVNSKHYSSRYQDNRIHGYESDDELKRLYKISRHGKNGAYERSRPESVMSDDQIYRISQQSLSSPTRTNFRSSSAMHNRSPSPENHSKYKIVRTKPSDDSSRQTSQEKQSSYKTMSFDSGYFEPEYATRTTHVRPSMRTTTLSPTRNSTVINLRRPDTRVTSPTRNEAVYRVVNVHSATDDKMSKTRRRRSRSSSEGSNSDGETRRYKISSSDIKENGLSNGGDKLYIQRTFSPSPVVENNHRLSKSKSRSQDPLYRVRSPSPQGRHKTIVDVRRDYTDNISKSYSDLSRSDKSYVVHGLRPSDQPLKSYNNNRSESFISDRQYRMRSPTPTSNNLSYRSFSNDLPPPLRSNTEFVTSGGRSSFMENTDYQTADKVYKINTEPQVVDTGEQSDLKVVRGQILIKNKIDSSKDEDDFDDNVNIFDNYFHLQKDNPLYQSDPDIYKSLEEEITTTTKTNRNIGDAYNQDITFETVENIAKEHKSQAHVSTTAPQKKQNLSQLLLSKLEKFDPKDIHQHIDVKHTNEEIFGDIEFISADGSPASSNDTKNFDSVSENVDLTLRDGKAFIIITVNAERIVPIDYEFNVWRKSAAIVTRQIEIDLSANDQRRRLYRNVMDTTGPRGALEDSSNYRRNSRTGEQEKVLNSMQTLKLFTEILDAAEGGKGDYDETSVKTRQMQGQGQLPANEEIDFMY